MVGGYIVAFEAPLNITNLPAVIPGAYKRSLMAVESKKFILINTDTSVVPLVFYREVENRYLFLSPISGYYVSVSSDDTVSLEAIT